MDEQVIFVPTYRVINGRWTLNGSAWDELTLKEREALGEYVSYFYPRE